MKRLFTYFILGLITMFLLSQCDYWPEEYPFLRFVNRSGVDVAVRISTEYPDTLINDYGFKRCSQHDTTELTTHFPIEELFAMNDTIQLIVLDWYHFRENYYVSFDSLNRNILRRYELTREWLEEHDWTVVYP